MTATKKERRNYDEEFITKLAVIETRQSTVIDELKQIGRHLKEINGSIVDYQITKNKVEGACLKLIELDVDVTTMSKLVSNIKTKVWSVAAFVGVICGGVGSAIGLLIAQLNGA